MTSQSPLMWKVPSKFEGVEYFFKSYNAINWGDILIFMRNSKHFDSPEQYYSCFHHNLDMISQSTNVPEAVKDHVQQLKQKWNFLKFKDRCNAILLARAEEDAIISVQGGHYTVIEKTGRRMQSAPPISPSVKGRVKDSRNKPSLSPSTTQVRSQDQLPLPTSASESSEEDPSSKSLMNVVVSEYEESSNSASVSTFVSESDKEIIEIGNQTPFKHLVMRLYKLYGHTPRHFDKPVSFQTNLRKELYNFAERILDNWSTSSRIDQKDCLVALSGIVNTMDPGLEDYYAEFSNIADKILDKDLFYISETQKAIIIDLKAKLGKGSVDDLRALRLYCSRHRDDLEYESLKHEWSEEQREIKSEEQKIMQLMEFICEDMLFTQRITDASEHEEVFRWRGIARILYDYDLVIRVGELGSISTRKEKAETENTFGGTDSNVRSRKIDIMHQMSTQGSSKPIELIAWEAKPSSARDEDSQVQLRKNIRTNASIMKTLAPYMDEDYPKPSAMILDILGSQALVYTLKKIEPGIHAAGLVCEKMLEIPRYADEIAEFLDGGNLSALLKIGLHNSRFASIIRRGYRKVQNQAAMAKFTRRHNVLEDEPSIIFSPTKKQKQKQPQYEN
ncbi:hypothetical protein BGZ49_006221 [Haplosporangium sp. Z 27]|nr:hypothetical protein BGZ49_006221 [Haplosporangium sp. Z 27]